MTPTQLSLKKLRDEGYFCEVVERWNPYARIRQDFAGFVDILALKKDEILAVQCTSWANVASRVKKIAEHENIGVVRDANIRVVVWGWKKIARGKWDYKEVDCS